jgi:hypothetical protein
VTTSLAGNITSSERTMIKNLLITKSHYTALQLNFLTQHYLAQMHFKQTLYIAKEDSSIKNLNGISFTARPFSVRKIENEKRQLLGS